MTTKIRMSAITIFVSLLFVTTSYGQGLSYPPQIPGAIVETYKAVDLYRHSFYSSYTRMLDDVQHIAAEYQALG